jgi:hypothetical protein
VKTLWFDFTNPPHVNFYLPLIRHFEQKGYSTFLTARDFVETSKLLEINKLQYQLIGKHGGGNKISKVFQLFRRDLLLALAVRNFDISFSSNYDAPLISWLKKKPALVFDDNDISPNWLYSNFARYVVSPAAMDKEAMYKMGIAGEKLITYNGYKENIYIADYIPDPGFLSGLPFRDFVVVRPENMQASYVSKGAVSIVPVLVEKLNRQGINVLYMPRYPGDRSLVSPHDRLFIAGTALNGLDVCYHSNAVLTGAGTFSREAAAMGVPAVSFYAGNEFLGVDRQLFADGKVFFSRDPDVIVDYVVSSEKKPFNKAESIAVQQEFFKLVDGLVSGLLR